MTPATPSVEKPAYLDPDLPIDERVKDLLSRLTLEEKISQMLNGCAAIPRLGIAAYDYWSEALHGIARNGRATVFPQSSRRTRAARAARERPAVWTGGA